MISKEIQKMLNVQVNAELWSAYLYLAMSFDSKHKGNTGAAHWCRIQSAEEVSHACIIQNYLDAQGVKTELHPLDPVNNTWKSSLAMFEDALKHEMMVTRMINDIMTKAKEQRDYATQSFLNWFVDEQVEEENECMKIVQKFKNAEDSKCTLFEIDKQLQKRNKEKMHHMRGENWIA